MKKPAFTLALLAILAVLTGAFWAGQPARAAPTYSSVALQPDENAGVDNYMRSIDPDQNMGTDYDLSVGEFNTQTNSIRRTLIKFNLSSIPAGSTVTSATLTLTVNADGSDNSRQYCIYRVKRAWGESASTWNSYTTGQAWQTPGAGGADDAETTNIGCATLANNLTPGTTVTWTLSASAVQEMLNGGAWPNNGFLVRANTELNDAYNFDSSGSSTPSSRPKLVIEYTEATPTPTPTQTHTPTKTPTASATPTASNTPTPSLTPTNTDTPTPSLTPTITDTPTITPTPSDTPVPTSTVYMSPTPTGTPAPIIWAESYTKVSGEILHVVASLLYTDPPDEASGLIYAATYIENYASGWLLSVANLDGIEAPYTDWNIEDNLLWGGIVQVSVSGNVYSAEYYASPTMGGDMSSGTLVFPWEPGKRAIYGVCGVHINCYTSDCVGGRCGIDFVSGSTLGSDMANDWVYAAQGGTITYVCNDGTSMGIHVSTGLRYYHFSTGNSFSQGQAVSAGAPIGYLRHGSFSGACGYASQQPTNYHVHLTFPETSTLWMGTCALNVYGETWSCPGMSVAAGQMMPVNTGGYYGPTPIVPTVGPGTPSPTPNPVGPINPSSPNIWTYVLSGGGQWATNLLSSGQDTSGGVDTGGNITGEYTITPHVISPLITTIKIIVSAVIKTLFSLQFVGLMELVVPVFLLAIIIPTEMFIFVLDGVAWVIKTIYNWVDPMR